MPHLADVQCEVHLAVPHAPVGVRSVVQPGGRCDTGARPRREEGERHVLRVFPGDLDAEIALSGRAPHRELAAERLTRA